jgi:phage-related protein
VTWVLKLVQELDRVPISFLKKLEGTEYIWEVRASLGGDTFRLLGFFHEGSLVVLTNGFTKKQQKTPATEIEVALARRRDHLTRSMKNG